MGGERGVVRGGEAGLGEDRAGRGIGDSDLGQDVTGQGEAETERCEEAFAEG